MIFETVTVGRAYAREKCPKTVERFPADPMAILLDGKRLLHKYAGLVVVDTNSRICGASKLSAASSTWIPSKESGFSGATAFHQSTLVFLSPVAENAELIGWQDIIERVIAGHDPGFGQ